MDQSFAPYFICDVPLTSHSGPFGRDHHCLHFMFEKRTARRGHKTGTMPNTSYVVTHVALIKPCGIGSFYVPIPQMETEAQKENLPNVMQLVP